MTAILTRTLAAALLMIASVTARAATVWECYVYNPVATLPSVQGVVRLIDTVKQQDVAELDPIDRTQAIKLENARDGVRILNLGQPGVGNMVFRVVFGYGNLLAEFGDVARGNPKAVTNVLELFAGRESQSHAAFYNTRQLNCQSVPSTLRL